MRQFEIGMLVKSKAGHDKDELYVILDMQDEYLYLVDGKIRTLDHPKKKKIKHVQRIDYIVKNVVETQSTNSLRNEDIKYAIKLYLSQGNQKA